ncbi:MAG TPA: MFS transporter, partial [Candidatus Limnocylindria bacterium]|nr:MFS transporter [Candidatus Limnocylindria bacterium]
GVWLLAPTWVALNAVLGSWTTQSVVQLVREPSGRFEGQLLMGGFAPTQVSIGLAIAMVVFFAGLFYWGNRFKTMRRTTIIGIGIGGGLVMMGAVFAINHSQVFGLLLQVPMLLLLLGGLFVMAGATPAALGLLADISESHPADRGAIMGLYSVFLAIGQIVGALVSGWAADWLGIDGLLAASLALLVVAVLPLQRLRASEHLVGARITDVPDLAAG